MKPLAIIFILLFSIFAMAKQNINCPAKLAALDPSLTGILDQMAVMLVDLQKADPESPEAIVTEGALRKKFTELESLLKDNDVRSTIHTYISEKIKSLTGVGATETKEQQAIETQAREEERLALLSRFVPVDNMVWPNQHEQVVVDKFTLTFDTAKTIMGEIYNQIHVRDTLKGRQLGAVNLKKYIGYPFSVEYAREAKALYVFTDKGLYAVPLPNRIFEEDDRSGTPLGSQKILTSESISGKFALKKFQVSEDGKMIAAFGNKTVTTYNVDTKMFNTLDTSIAIIDERGWNLSPNGKFIIAGFGNSMDGIVRLYDAATGGLIKTFKMRGIKNAFFSSDSKWFVANTQLDITMRNIEGPDVRHRFRVVNDKGELIELFDDSTMVFSPDDSKLFVSTKRGLAIWDVLTRRYIQSLDLTHSDFTPHISDDGRVLSTFENGGEGHVSFWELQAPK